jgi:hypothetical protein
MIIAAVVWRTEVAGCTEEAGCTEVAGCTEEAGCTEVAPMPLERHQGGPDAAP